MKDIAMSTDGVVQSYPEANGTHINFVTVPVAGGSWTQIAYDGAGEIGVSISYHVD